MPAVSVLMVTHRATPFLRAALDSVRAQTFTDWELVLVDNGAGLRDGDLGTIGSDPRLRLVRRPVNEGIAAGHNAGVAAATGEFIALLDHDDLALPRRLERQVARLRAEPGLVLVSALAEAIDDTGRCLGREFALTDAGGHRSYSQFAAPFFTPACTGPRATFTARRYRGEFTVCADFDFITRVIEAGPTAVVPEVLLQYRHHAAQATVAQARRVAAERAGVRLLTARRRAGREEGPAIFAAPGDADSTGMILRQYAHRALEEGFPLLAAYHARRSVAEEYTFGAMVRAVGLWLRAARSAAAGQRGEVTRMFFTGPVRALRLAPA